MGLFGIGGNKGPYALCHKAEKTKDVAKKLDLFEEAYNSYRDKDALQNFLCICAPEELDLRNLKSKYVRDNAYVDLDRCVRLMETYMVRTDDWEGEVKLRKSFRWPLYLLYTEGEKKYRNPERAKLYLREECRAGRVDAIKRMMEQVNRTNYQDEDALLVYPCAFYTMDKIPFDKKTQDDIMAHMAVYIAEQNETVMEVVLPYAIRRRNSIHTMANSRMGLYAIREVARDYQQDWNMENNRAQVERTIGAFENREAYVKRGMEGYNKELDARERTMNSLFTENFKTHDEMLMTGEITESEHFSMSILRSTWEDEHRKKLMEEYAQQKKERQKENPFDDLAETGGKALLDIELFDLGEKLRKQGRFEEAEKALLSSANMGYTYAYVCLGNIYADEEQVRDCAKAETYFKKAIEHQEEDAMFNLGLMYLDANGDKGVRDYQKAKTCFMMGVLHGSVEAACHLGAMNARGWAMEKNYKKALFWYELSLKNAENGEYPLAKENAEDIRKLMEKEEKEGG